MTMPNSLTTVFFEIQVELSDVNEGLLDPIAHERVSNYRKIVRLNSAHVGKLNELVAKVR